MKDILKLLRITLREKKRLVFFFCCSIFVAFFTYIFVNLVQPILDNMLRVQPQAAAHKTRLMDFVFQRLHIGQDEMIWFIPLLIVIVLFGKGVSTFLASLTMNSIGYKSSKRLRDGLFEHLVYQSLDFFDRKSTGEIMSRVTNDVDKIQVAVSGSMGEFIQEFFVLCALLVYIFITDWRLALVAFIIAPLAAIPLAVFSQKLKKRGKRNQARMADIYSNLFETITGNKIVKAFTMEKFELKKFYSATKNYFKTSMRLAVIESLSSPFMEFLGGIVGAFVLWVGMQRITDGHISPGDFGSFIVAIFYSYTPIKRLSRANNAVQQGVASHERINEILDRTPTIVDSPSAYPLPPVKGKVCFRDVSFSYNEDRPVLHQVSFDIQPTEMIAIVGLSGSGKTTIINLLSRFYAPGSGRILIDDIDISDVTLKSLRSQIGLVTQELILFNESICKNIAYGMEDMPLERIERAAKAAMAHDFILELPQKYDTQIGEKGVLLSSGQRQRLAIARALLKNPPILILDEATSSLDSESERLIQIALTNVMKNRTTLVIAHRLSTIRNADRIFVVDRGRIAEIGTHEQLLEKDGIYKKLYDLQFPEEKEGLV
ncbi:MAG: ABC transporter ATP-binding protein [Candidatus Aminicenantes bacterium]|nr:ABC transporter ATP-binding protein [Candidatus Aminicenantes bacterium]